MRNHKKVKAIRSKFGPVGYCVWSMILEYLTGNDGNVFEYSDLEFELMSGDFGIPATEIRAVVDYCVSLEMLFNVNGFIKSESLDERLAPVYQKRGAAKELSKKQLRENGKFTTSNTAETVVSVAETPQSKVKESKGNERKLDNAPEFKTEISDDWTFWGNQILNGQDHGWEAMKGRKITAAELDTFLSVAVRNDWTMDTQQKFRISLKGFKAKDHQQLTTNGAAAVTTYIKGRAFGEGQ